jgi:hypothetical protein
MMMEKTKAHDKILLAIGVDEKDVMPNVFKLEM